MSDDLSTGAMIGIGLVFITMSVAFVLLLVQAIGGTMPSVSVTGGASLPSFAEVLGVLKWVGLGVGALIAGATANYFAHIGERIHHRWMCATKRGMYRTWRTASGTLEMSCDTFYALFVEHPEKYCIGHYKCRYIPTILYNSSWDIAVESNYVNTYELPYEKCVQIRLPYKAMPLSLESILKGKKTAENALKN